jgi:hypothetical protein
MSLDISRLIDKSPKQLSQIKTMLLSKCNFTDAETVEGYIRHCITTNKVVKGILNS